MIKNNCFKILSNLSKKELKRFKDFLQSPFFNKNEKLINLFNLIILDYPNFKNKNLTKENLHNALYPNRKFVDSTIRHLFSDFMDLLERFLKEINFEGKEIESRDFLRAELLSRSLYDLLEINIRDTTKLLEKEGQLDESYFLKLFKLETDKINVNIIRKFASNKENISTDLNNYLDRAKYLILFFFLEIIKNFHYLQKYARLYNVNLEIYEMKIPSLIEQFELFMNSNKNNYKNYDFIFEIYFAFHQAFANQLNDKYYYDYKKLLEIHSDKFSLDEKHFLFSRLVDFCILKLKSDSLSDKFERELFDVYKLCLVKGYFKNSQSNHIQVSFFRNIIHCATNIKEYEWLEKFINTYLELVPVEKQLNVYNYSMAYLAFEKKDFSNALNYLNRIKFDNFDFKVDAKILYIKIYYETNEIESLISSVQSMREYLRKNKLISSSRKSSFKNFLMMINFLIKYRLSPYKYNVNDLKYRLINEQYIESKRWLIKIVDSL